MSATKRIVCYAINGSGLGHLTRLTAVARWMRRYVGLLDNRTPEVLFLTSSDASDSLASAGFAAFKIPSKTVAKQAQLDKLEYRRLAKHFVWNTLGVFAPDLFVVDTFPSGSFDELFQVLDGPFKKGFIYRDVKPEYAARPTFRSALRLYDTVVAPHARDRSETNGSAAPDSPVRYTGEVVQFERADLLPPDSARQQLGVAPGKRLVYVSAGGGGDPQAESTLFAIVEALRKEPDLHLLVGAGPLYRGQRISGERLTWFDASNVWRFFSAVDAAVCAAGYNTFHELLFARVPTAFYPQPKIADDQAERVAAAEASNACLLLHDVADMSQVQRCVRELLNAKSAAAIREGCNDYLTENGARKCAIELLRPLYTTNQLHWAATVMSPAITHSLESINDGTTSIATNWLSLLLPQNQLESVASHPGLDNVLDRLSPSAAREVQSLLANTDQTTDFAAFESQLLKLVDAIKTSSTSGQQSDLQLLADDALKTLGAAVKKQPLDAASQGNYTQWIGSVTEAVRGLLQHADSRMTAPDVMQMYRMFPRIVDATAAESFELFTAFLNQARTTGATTPDVLRQLQVMKMTHTKVTREIVQNMLQAAEAAS